MADRPKLFSHIVLTRIVLWFGTFVTLPVLTGIVLLSLLYYMPVAAIHGAAGVVFALALPVRFPREGSIKMLSAVVLLAASVVTVPVALAEMNRQTDRLAQKVERDGPEALTIRERSGVYLLGLCAVGAGIFVYPEVAKELFYLYVPAAGGTRRFESDFAMASAKIRASIGSFSQSLSVDDRSQATMKTRRVAWRSYSGPFVENRVAFALNPCVLRAAAHRDGHGWVVEASAVVAVEFPRRSRTTVARFGQHRLELEEGLFWALQQVGWLHPYTAEWIWRFRV